MAVRPGARATAPRLHAEQVVEHRDDEVVVQVAPARPAHHERHDRQPVRVEVAEDLDVRVGTPGLDRPPQEVLLVRADHVHAHGLLEVEHQAGPDGLHDRRGAALLPVGGVVDVVVVGRVDVVDRAAARHGRYPVAQQVAADHQDARRTRPAHELVRRQEHRVLVRLGVAGTSAVHLDVDVRGGGREVPERQRAVPVQQVGDRVGVADDAGDVRGRRERADP